MGVLPKSSHWLRAGEIPHRHAHRPELDPRRTSDANFSLTRPKSLVACSKWPKYVSSVAIAIDGGVTTRVALEKIVATLPCGFEVGHDFRVAS